MDSTTTMPLPPVPESEDSTSTQPPAVNFMTMPIDNQNDALNVMVGFLNIAQRRGAFGVDESARIWEAMKFFIVQQPTQESDLGANTLERQDTGPDSNRSLS